jgi:membrane protein DedA with SNARE-associated domain
MIALLAGLALSTLISEDLASIGAGLLAREGQVPLVYAVVACTVGVYIGDLGLWGLGFVVGRRSVRIPWLSRALGTTSIATVRSQFEKRLGASILVSRFVPGSRLPMYVAMGIWGQRPLAFAAWSLVAVIAWTPALVIATMYFGDVVVMHALMGIATGVFGALVTASGVWVATRLAGRGVARVVRHYHQRLAHTMETPT